MIAERRIRSVPQRPASGVLEGAVEGLSDAVARADAAAARLEALLDRAEAVVLRPAALRSAPAAEYLGISETTLVALARRGEVETAMVGGRRVYTVASLDAYLARQVDAERARAGME